MASSSSSSAAAAGGIASPGRQAREKEQRADEHAGIDLLSDDTLLHMMRCLSTRDRLSSVAPVCHRWRRLCAQFAVDELVPLFTNLSKKPWGKMRKKRLLGLAATHAATLERVHLHGLKQVKGTDVIALCQSLPKLHDLSIISCPGFYTTDLEIVANQLPSQLLSLDIHWDRVVSFPCTVNDNILASIHQHCPLLQKLDLDMSSTITRNGLDGLLQACPLLTSLDLHSHSLGWPEVLQVFKCCKSLRHFSLVSPLLIQNSDSSDDDDDRTFEIRNGDTRNGFYLPPAISLGEEMPKHLTSIRLYSSPNHSVPFEMPPMLKMLRSNGHQLQQLHAQGLFNASWHMITVWCANLKSLDLTHYTRNSLHLTGIEEVVVCGLISSLRKLEHIALPEATDRVLIELGRFGYNLREIRFLEFNLKNTAVTDRGVVAVAEGCPELRVLSLSGCLNLTIFSARALAFHCRHLQVLLLTKCENLTDAAVVVLLPRLNSSLIFLDLIGCRITQSALEAILQYAKVTTLRVVAVGKPLWQRSRPVISDIHHSNPRLRIRNESGIVWDGLYHGRVFS